MSFARIYPGIGLGRVGNSPNEIFMGPEAPGYARSCEDPWNSDETFAYKDAQLRIKRQGVRFRVFLYDEDQRGKGYYAKPSKEITLDDGCVKSIRWKVTLANKKASSYNFMVFQQSTPKIRNPKVKDRESLNITPSPRTIDGRSVNFNGGDPNFQFDDGSFLGKEVNLGELRTDPHGRLVVLGGHGNAEMVKGGTDLTVDPFNNDGWHDDMSDGPIECTIRLEDGTRLVAEQASVQFAPPKFAPHVLPAVTFYEVMKEIAEDRSFLPGRSRDCEFYRDIYPMLQSAVQHAWVSEGSFLGHQKGMSTLEIPYFDTAPTSSSPGKPVSNIAQQSEQEKAYIKQKIEEINSSPVIRNRIFTRLRIPMALASSEEKEEQKGGDYMPYPSDGDVTLTVPQYKKMEMWANGDFTVGSPEELRGTFNSGDPGKDIPLADQPHALDKAGLLHGTGNALNPGIEFGFVMTCRGTFKAAFRVNEQIIGPGDIGKNMAVPWQADFWACFLNWWPSSRPENVVSEEEYFKQGTSASSNSLKRAHWDRGFKGMHDLQRDDNWAKMGFVVPMAGRDGHKVYVESQRDPQLISMGDDEPFHPDLEYILELINSRQHSTL